MTTLNSIALIHADPPSSCSFQRSAGSSRQTDRSPCSCCCSSGSPAPGVAPACCRTPCRSSTRQTPFAALCGSIWSRFQVLGRFVPPPTHTIALRSCCCVQSVVLLLVHHVRHLDRSSLHMALAATSFVFVVCFLALCRLRHAGRWSCWSMDRNTQNTRAHGQWRRLGDVLCWHSCSRQGTVERSRPFSHRAALATNGSSSPPRSRTANIISHRRHCQSAVPTFVTRFPCSGSI